MKTTGIWRSSKSALLLITILLVSCWSTAQNPSVTDPGLDADYASQKQARTAQLRQSNNSSTEVAPNTSLERSSSAAALTKATSACFIPLDASYTAIPRNDDGSFGPIALPFTFDLYGASYTQVWINTNGNLTFTGPYSAYSASGFPFSIPMVAPFWGDVDTRNTAGGQIYYKLSATNLIVTWDNVGYYNQQVDKLNEFQVVISDGLDPITGLGQNVCFNYGDMQWTTGSASSGVNGFGGTPATVGVNKGNNIDFYQLGRFNQNNAAYDGPGGNPDGINYLDQQCYCSQVNSAVNIAPIANQFPSGVINIDCGETYNLNFSFIPPEVNQTVSSTVNVNGACGTTFSSTTGSISDVSFSFTGQPCNEGTNVITFTATDNGTPVETTTVTLTINVGSCCDITASSTSTNESCANQSDGTISVSTTGGTAPLSYSIDGGATYSSSANFTGLSTGTYVVVAQDANGCESVPQTITISGPSALVATSSATAILCNGGTATVTVSASGGTPPYSGTGNFTVNAGPYSYTVTDANGCTSVTTGSVSEPTPLVVTSSGTGQTGPCNGPNQLVNGDFQSYTGSIQQGNSWINNNLDNWSVSHGTPSGFGNLRMWMWSYSGYGEGMFTNFNFVAGQEYELTYELDMATDANPTATYIARLNNGMTPSSGSTFIPSTAGTQLVSNVAWDLSGTTLTITETFIANSNYSQLWFYPYLTGGPTPNQAAAAIDNITITEVVPCPSGGILCNGGTTDITVSATGGTAPYTGDGTYTVGAGTYNYPVTDANGCTETVSVTVTEPDALVLSISATSIDCNGGSADVTVSATGGTAPYTGTGTFNVTAGTYDYTVTDANGCSEIVSITVTEPTQLAASISATSIDCNGGSADITVSATGGTAPYTGTGVYSVTAGTYDYTVTDANGCSEIVSITVTEPTQLAASISATSIDCNGGSADITVSATGGTAPYTGTGVYSVTAGTYDYTVTDANGCSETVSITVTEPTQLAASISATSIDCNGGSADITVSATGGTAPYAGTGVYSVTAGTYTYTVTDANGCSVDVTITVTEPTQLVSTASSTAILCNGGTSTVTVSATGGTAPYSGTGNFTVSAGTYAYTVTDANGCSETVSITVTEPTQLVSSASSTAILCNGGTSTVTVSATGGTAPYSGTGNFTALAGTHTYTVTDANGCTSDVAITITEPTQLVASASSTVIPCFGGTSDVTVSATGGTPPYSGTGVNTVSAGSYTYTVTDANGCTSDVTIVVDQPDQIEANITPQNHVIDCIPIPVTLTANPTGGTGGPYTYLWSTGETTASIDVNPNTSTTYTVEVTDGNGCTVNTATNGTTVTVLNRCGNNNQKVVICHVPPGNTGNPQTICISPNALNPHLSTLWDLHGGDYCGPCQTTNSMIASDNINKGDNMFIRAGINMNNETIDLSYRIGYDSPVRLEIYDMAGTLVEVVHESHANEGELYEFTLNTAKISSGVYIYQFITNNEKHIDKLQIIQ